MFNFSLKFRVYDTFCFIISALLVIACKTASEEQFVYQGGEPKDSNELSMYPNSLNILTDTLKSKFDKDALNKQLLEQSIELNAFEGNGRVIMGAVIDTISHCIDGNSDKKIDKKEK